MKSISLPLTSDLAARINPDEPHKGDPRTAFQHDKDRILYSTAFRRLQYKTQVYAIHEGDLYRTRLTHTLEVAQIARALASLLNAEPDLAEAISFAHDVGHAPFGHAGGEKLKDLASSLGVLFEHNVQSYKLITRLEERYALFDGLNLTRATLQGIIRHCTFFDNPEEIKANIPAELKGEISEYWKTSQPTAEAQIVSIADLIAYAAHDIEDALSVGLISWDMFVSKISEMGVDFLTELINGELSKQVNDYKMTKLVKDEISILKIRTRIMSRLIVNKLIIETVRESKIRIQALPNKLELWMEIQNSPSPCITMSDPYREQVTRLINDVLFNYVYQDPRVILMMEKGKTIIEKLFNAFMDQPKALPMATQLRLLVYFKMSEKEQKAESGKSLLARGIVDYISGMTDKYAMDMYQLFTQAYEKAL